MEEHILFIDETGQTPHNPYFCLSGVDFERNYYEDIVTKEFNTLKKRHFETSDIILHYSDMNNKKGVFEIFNNIEIRQKFWTDYVNTIKKLTFTSFGVYFNQKDMKAIYKNGKSGIYDISFIALLKNYLHFLKSINALGSICLESRTFKENSILQQSYYNYLENGSMYFTKKDYSAHLSSIGFIVKGDNCTGLQIADIAPSCLIRKINKTKDHFGLGKIYEEKLYCYNNPYQDILGMKNLL